MALTITLTLKSTQPLDSIVASYISFVDLAFKANISITCSIHVHLKVIIYLVMTILCVELHLQVVDFLLEDARLLNQRAAVSIYTVQLLKDQIQTLLKRRIILLKLSKVLVGGGSYGADTTTRLLSARQKPVRCVSHINVTSWTP